MISIGNLRVGFRTLGRPVTFEITLTAGALVRHAASQTHKEEGVTMLRSTT